MKIIMTFSSYYTKKKFDLRWFIDLTVKPRIVNLLEEKIENIHELGWAKILAQNIKRLFTKDQKTGQLDFIKKFFLLIQGCH